MSRPAHRSLYKTQAWRKGRLDFLSDHPLCVKCEREGRIEPATVVDHITPHKGDDRLFYDRNNWQSLCKPHHDGDKQREERQAEADRERGFSTQIGPDGWPVDDRHPVYRS
jgi:5-methylcytosine-specific restriction endonuclease McrA